MIETRLDAIRAAVTDDALFERAVGDAMTALMQPLVGLSVREAVTALDKLRADIEKVNHDRQQRRPTIRIPGWRPR